MLFRILNQVIHTETDGKSKYYLLITEQIGKAKNRLNFKPEVISLNLVGEESS